MLQLSKRRVLYGFCGGGIVLVKEECKGNECAILVFYVSRK